VLYSNDALGDPTLNIRAQRVIQPSSTFSLSKNDQPITAGIRLTGRAKNPHLGFYSNPAMTDADVISYLIVGRPQSKVNEAQAELLFDAVSQLAILIGNKRGDVQFNLAEKLKLDQLGFAKRSSFMSSNKVAGPTKNPLEDTVLVLGKQLSDKLYLNYSVGIMDSANNIGLRYLLGKNITIEAATGPEGSSADIVFSFENG
jgi:translocation and assembly module TamB